jgi:hypothetical protein
MSVGLYVSSFMFNFFVLLSGLLLSVVYKLKLDTRFFCAALLRAGSLLTGK